MTDNTIENEDTNKSIEKYYLKKLKQNPDNYNLIGTIGKNILAVSLYAVKLNEKNIKYVPADLILQNEELFNFLLGGISRHVFYKDLDDKLKKNEKITITALKGWDDSNIRYVPKTLINDRAFVSLLIQNGFTYFSKLPQKMQDDEDLCLEFLSNIANAQSNFKQVELIKTKKNLALKSLKFTPFVYKELSEDLKKDNEILDTLLGHMDTLKLIEANLWTNEIVKKALNISSENWIAIRKDKVNGKTFYNKEFVLLALGAADKEKSFQSAMPLLLTNHDVVINNLYSLILKDIGLFLKEKELGFREVLDNIQGKISKNIINVLMKDKELHSLFQKYKIPLKKLDEEDFRALIREVMLLEKLPVDVNTLSHSRAKI